MMFGFKNICRYGFTIGIALSMAGCGKHKNTPAILGRMVLREHTIVTHASVIDPQSVLISMDAAGKIYRNGVVQSSNIIPEYAAPLKSEGGFEGGSNRDPILLEIHPQLQFGALSDLMIGLIVRGSRVNIAFVVNTASGYRGLTLPISDFHWCSGTTHYFDGGIYHQEPMIKPAPFCNIWVHVRAGSGGSIRISKVDYGEDELWLRTSDRKTRYSPKDGPPRSEWEGIRPALGTWTTRALHDFLADPRVAKNAPFVLMDVYPSDNVNDVLLCLSNIKSVPGVRLLANIRAK